ncbi:hypothetical protein PH213_20315 [Streptomyces sp. SRF1]|uniref:hypothetical protein n=1 Tax=Streptomyces sp. SRF1 TaxID=1549642 RepID=UPI0025AFB8F5|nr:hypothetical protein [Streptomyces sp. SRF1]MDN3056851.1 hypothetical protein [Streptomyces sp. SRF1]
MIHIQPARARRVAFARWAVAQRPKIRTVSAEAFAVPPRLFVQAPEDILIGALVDGHRYVSPEEDRVQGRPAPGAPELLGVATPAGLTPGPEAGPLDGPTPAHEPVPALPAIGHPHEAADSDSSDPTQVETGAYRCGRCPRSFTTARGRDAHRRQAHRED